MLSSKQINAIPFTDTEYLSADDKRKILKQWVMFCASGFSHDKFTDRLYEHLILHCGFIAHYDIDGFYCEYFGAYGYIDCFVNQMNSYNCMSCYDDINSQMKSVLSEIGF